MPPFYDPALMLRQGVVIQLSTESGIGSAAIRYLSNSPYSHIDFVLPPGLKLPDGTTTKGGELLGARMSGGVQVRPPNYVKFTKVQRYICRAAPWAVYEYAISQIGKPYDVGGIVNFFSHDRNWHDPDKWFCSELGEAAFEHEWEPLIIVEDSDQVTPRDLTLSVKLEKIAIDYLPWRSLAAAA
jgi:hypothetical protein